jgi:uncharacterized tellurite resistance protein B-like protein
MHPDRGGPVLASTSTSLKSAAARTRCAAPARLRRHGWTRQRHDLARFVTEIDNADGRMSRREFIDSITPAE